MAHYSRGHAERQSIVEDAYPALKHGQIRVAKLDSEMSEKSLRRMYLNMMVIWSNGQYSGLSCLGFD